MGIEENDKQRVGIEVQKVSQSHSKNRDKRKGALAQSKLWATARKRVTHPERKLLKRIVLLFYDFRLSTSLDGKNRSNP